MKEESQNIIKELKNEKKNDKKNEKDSSLSNNIDSEEAIQAANLKIIKDAENQKLILRDKLVVAIKHIIWFQLVFFNIVVLTIVLSVTVEFPFLKSIDEELCKELFTFVKYYISATIVELLGMLVFILHYVFSDFRFMEPLKSKLGERWKTKNEE